MDDITDGITYEIARDTFALLTTDGYAVICMDEGIGLRRIVLAMMADKQEIMIAMEGSGCIFLRRDANLNVFTFIQQGFQMRAATAMVELFAAFGRVQADINTHLLTHQKGSN